MGMTESEIAELRALARYRRDDAVMEDEPTGSNQLDRLRAVALEVAKACEAVHNSAGRNEDVGFAFRFACIRIDEAIGVRPEGWGASAVALRALAGGAA